MRKAILLIHGFAGGCYDYGDFPNDLESHKNFDVYTFTLPGHEKFLINKVSKDDWLKASEIETEKLINKGYRTIYVIGYSMGGIIAAYIASKYTEVKKLVLAAPAFKYFTFKDNKLDIMQSIKRVPSLFKDYNIDLVLSRVLKVSISTIKEFINLADTHINDIKKIEIPALIIHGINDDIVGFDSVNYVYDNISSKSVTLIELNNLNHSLFLNDRYEEIKNIIINFLINYNLSIKEIKKI
jgi:esterase/lipase